MSVLRLGGLREPQMFGVASALSSSELGPKLRKIIMCGYRKAGFLSSSNEILDNPPLAWGARWVPLVNPRKTWPEHIKFNWGYHQGAMEKLRGRINWPRSDNPLGKAYLRGFAMGVRDASTSGGYDPQTSLSTNAWKEYKRAKADVYANPLEREPYLATELFVNNAPNVWVVMKRAEIGEKRFNGEVIKSCKSEAEARSLADALNKKAKR